MKTGVLCFTAIILTCCFTMGFAQPEPAPPKVLRYKVMRFEDLFSDDEAANAKVKQVSFSSTYSDGSQYQHGSVRRTDMDAEDYEAALNRMATKGWTFQGATKSNYFIFSR